MLETTVKKAKNSTNRTLSLTIGLFKKLEYNIVKAPKKMRIYMYLKLF